MLENKPPSFGQGIYHFINSVNGMTVGVVQFTLILICLPTRPVMAVW